jgi:hypothetical protein
MATTTPFSSLTKKLHSQNKSFHNDSISLITFPHLVPLSKEQEDALVEIIVNHPDIMKNLHYLEDRTFPLCFNLKYNVAEKQ